MRPLRVLLQAGPTRRGLVLEFTVTGVGAEKLKFFLYDGYKAFKCFHERVVLLFAGMAVGVAAAFLLEQFGVRLNFRPRQLNQVDYWKRLCGHRQDQRSTGNNRLHRETLSGRWLRLVRSPGRPQRFQSCFLEGLVICR